MNYLIQETKADILMTTLRNLPAALSGLDANIVNLIHDEILLKTSERDAEKAGVILARVMEDAFCSVLPQGKAFRGNIVEWHQGKSWAEANGMKI